MRSLLVVSLICAFSCVLAMDTDPYDNPEESLRINQLLPNTFYPLMVEPAIPGDFVAMAPNGKIDLYDWVYWGPQDVLESYFKNPNSLKQAIIRVKFSENVAQTSPDTFGNGVSEFINQLKQINPDAVTERRWGKYPVVAIKEKMRNRVCNMAWVGLNVPGSGWTLLFNLIYPENKNEPSKQDEMMWTTFITDTLPL